MDTTKSFFLRYNFVAVIISIYTFMISTIITSIYIYRNFKKTRATEIFFFCAFLAGCFSEISRLLIPINGLWTTISPLELCIGQAVVLGRILCPLSFIFIALMSEPEQRLNEERHIVIIFITSLFFAAIIPINTAGVTDLCLLRWGYDKILTAFRVLAFVLSGISMYISNLHQNTDKTKRITIGYTILIVGYFILCHTRNYVMLLLGMFCFCYGVYFYLSNLHRKYLWL